MGINGEKVWLVEVKLVAGDYFDGAGVGEEVVGLV